MLLLATLGLLSSNPVAAQFQVAVPPQVSADTVRDAQYLPKLRLELQGIITALRTPDTSSALRCITRDLAYTNIDTLYAALGFEDLKSGRVDSPRSTDVSKEIERLQAAFSNSLKDTSSKRPQAKSPKQIFLYSCTDGTKVYLEDSQLRIATPEGAIVSHRANGGFNRRHWVHTLPKSYERVASLYAAKGVGFLTNVSAGISDDDAYLTTSIISGVAWRFHFSASLMQSLSKAESPDPAALSTDLFRERQNAVQRLIYNGGSAAVRLLLPFGAEGGRHAQRSGGLYIQLGAVGNLTEQKDLRATVGVVAEHMIALAVRDPSNSDKLGEFLFGLRGGLHWVPESTGILRGAADPAKSIAFGQVLLGLRQSDKIDYAVVYTFAQSRYKDYFQPVQFRVKASTGGSKPEAGKEK